VDEGRLWIIRKRSADTGGVSGKWVGQKENRKSEIRVALFGDDEGERN